MAKTEIYQTVDKSITAVYGRGFVFEKVISKLVTPSSALGSFRATAVTQSTRKPAARQAANGQ